MTYHAASPGDASRGDATRIFPHPGLLGPRPILVYLSAIGGLAGLILSGMVFGEILEHIQRNGWLGTDADRAISDFTAGNRTGWLTDSMRQVTNLGASAVLTAVVLLATAGMLLLRRFRLAVVMVAAAVGSSGLTLAMKAIIERPRPETNGEIIFASSSSFPSGHTLESAAVYGALVLIFGSLIVSRPWRLGVWAAGAILALGIGVSRVYLGVHWASDAAAGWLLGFVLVAGIVGLAHLDRYVAQVIWYDSPMRTLTARGSILGIVAVSGAAAFLIGLGTRV